MKNVVDAGKIQTADAESIDEVLGTKVEDLDPSTRLATNSEKTELEIPPHRPETQHKKLFSAVKWTCSSVEFDGTRYNAVMLKEPELAEILKTIWAASMEGPRL